MLLYRTQKKIHCKCYVKDSQEIPCQLCILCLNTASDKVAGKVTSGTIAVTVIARPPYNGWKQLNKKLLLRSLSRNLKSKWRAALRTLWVTSTTYCRVLLQDSERGNAGRVFKDAMIAAGLRSSLLHHRHVLREFLLISSTESEEWKN